MGYIYVLSLVENKIYVGYSDNFINRIEQHFESCGSAWTKKYSVIKVISLKEGTKKDEATTTLKLMKKHGVDNVRGGPWCKIILDVDPFEYNPELYGDHMQDRCYKCGRPGHYAANCFAKSELICENCGKRGHYASRCYVKNKKENLVDNDLSRANTKKKLVDGNSFKNFKNNKLVDNAPPTTPEKRIKNKLVDNAPPTSPEKRIKNKLVDNAPPLSLKKNAKDAKKKFMDNDSSININETATSFSVENDFTQYNKCEPESRYKDIFFETKSLSDSCEKENNSMNNESFEKSNPEDEANLSLIVQPGNNNKEVVRLQTDLDEIINNCTNIFNILISCFNQSCHPNEFKLN